MPSPAEVEQAFDTMKRYQMGLAETQKQVAAAVQAFESMRTHPLGQLINPGAHQPTSTETKTDNQTATSAPEAAGDTHKRTMSDASKKALSLKMRKIWAERKRGGKKPKAHAKGKTSARSAKPKRTLNDETRKVISEKLKAKWAERKKAAAQATAAPKTETAAATETPKTSAPDATETQQVPQSHAA